MGMDAQRTRRKWLKQGGSMTLLTLLTAAGWIKPGTATAQSWNTSYEPRPRLPDDIRKQLQQEFTPEIERLSVLLNRDLNYWSQW